ncbi:MAG: hypothetical protein CMJ83_18115 [Planctomycetes bacterium]|nr:hypothetical protein [Planctomycetota bacterium]
MASGNGDLATRIEQRLPAGAAAVWTQLVRRDESRADTLDAEVRGYLEALAELAKTNESLNLEAARRVGDHCTSLIEKYGAHARADVRKVVQATVAYFIEDDDEEGDTTSIIGFDDDALVVRVAAEALEAELGDGA